MQRLIIFAIWFTLNLSTGLEYNKQLRHNPNSDFLLHEAGGIPTGSKRDYVAPQLSTNNPTKSPNIQQPSSPGKVDYTSQFPALGVPSSSSPQTTVKPNPTPSLGSPAKSQSSSGKRDYVAPQHSNTNPSQGNAGKVKDLVNFYENKDQNGPQKTPSYSSVLQGSGGNTPGSTVAVSSTTKIMQTVTQTPKVSFSHTPKPFSFSSVVAGSSKPSSKPTTFKPSTKPHRTSVIPASPTSRPGTSVLPSSIVNNNRNGNQGGTNRVSDAEIQILSEELLRKDSNNAAKYITVNYQEKTTSQSKEDKAPQPLLTVGADAWNIPTVQKFLPLLDNYERDTLVNEYVTPQERNEENAFMDAVMATSVIRHLMTFLKEKGYVTPDPRNQRDFLKQLWFSLYSRGKGKISSSGFEHVFVSELKNGGVSGLHNWIYFSKEEAANRINYLGYLKYEQLGDKGVVMKLHFNQQGVDKPVDSMFIGTSPELEMALYTLCFVTRADNDCKLKLGTKDIEIVTHTFRYRSKNLIGSAYPQI